MRECKTARPALPAELCFEQASHDGKPLRPPTLARLSMIELLSTGGHGAVIVSATVLAAGAAALYACRKTIVASLRAGTADNDICPKFTLAVESSRRVKPGSLGPLSLRVENRSCSAIRLLSIRAVKPRGLALSGRVVDAHGDHPLRAADRAGRSCIDPLDIFIEGSAGSNTALLQLDLDGDIDDAQAKGWVATVRIAVAYELPGSTPQRRKHVCRAKTEIGRPRQEARDDHEQTPDVGVGI